MRSSTKNQNSYKKLIFLVIALLLCGLAFFLLEKNNITNFFGKQTSTPVVLQDEQQTINFSPPTEEEKSEADKVKDKLTSNPIPVSEETVKPIITFGGQYGANVEIAAYVPNVYEDGGTCTLTIEQEGESIIKTQNAEKDVNKVLCPTFVFSRSELGSGTSYEVYVTYESDAHKGTSDKKSITVN